MSIIRTDNKVFWAGKTDSQGIAIAPQTRLRNARNQWKFAFIVTAQKDGDVAYVGSDWNEGISPYEFGTGYDLTEADALLRGTVFTDRGVYKLGEEVHFKGVLRSDSASGIQLIRNGTPLYVALHDSRGKVIDRRTVTMNQWSTTEWTAKLPADGALGDYQVVVSLDKKALEDDAAAAGERRRGEWTPPWRASGPRELPGGGVPAPGLPRGRQPRRRPADRRVAAQGRRDRAVPLRRADGETPGRVELFTLAGLLGAGRHADKYPSDRFVFVGCCDPDCPSLNRSRSRRRAAPSTRKGSSRSISKRGRADGIPYQYSLEGDVEDVSRQHIAGRASFLVHPASWYIGLQRPSGSFVEQKDGLKTAVVAVSPSGVAVPGVKVDVTLVARAVEQRASRRRQRLLHVGDRKKRN